MARSGDDMALASRTVDAEVGTNDYRGELLVTQYVIVDRRTDPKFPIYLVKGVDIGTIEASHAGWTWTSDRRKATRFDGRRSAEDFADRVESWIKTHCDKTVRLSIVPATGGMEITRQSVKTIG